MFSTTETAACACYNYCYSARRSKMTKSNKAAAAPPKETIYDRCSYVGCYNGKFSNNRKLFHFPAETDRRLEMWIERSGNFRLRAWAATSLRKAGICSDHFDDNSFTDKSKRSLRRNSVPRHYTDDIKLKKLRNKAGPDEGLLIPRNNVVLTMTRQIKPIKLNRNFVKLEETCSDEPENNVDSPLSESDNIIEESSYDETSNDEETDNIQRSTSPVVEYIVEELDETLISEKSPIPFEEVVVEEQEKEQRSQENYNDPLNDQQTYKTFIHRPNEPEEKSSNVQTRKYEESHRANVDALWIEHPVERTTIKEQNEVSSINDVTALTNNAFNEKAINDLRKENKYLRKSLRLLRQNLDRTRVREANYTRMRHMLRSVDEFLNIQNCDNPLARGMVKIALHQEKTAYTREEKEFSTKLYRDSILAFDNLRKSGCNLPCNRTMKRWLTEENCATSSNCDDVTELDDFYDETRCYVDEASDEVDDDDDEDEKVVVVEGSNDYANNRIIYMPVTMDGMEEAVVNEEVMIDEDFVEEFEAQMEDTESQEEYIEALPPDENYVDSLK